MATVIYRGKADIRVLSANDLKRVGVEGFRKTEFHNGEPIEVSSEVAKVLVNNSQFGNFEGVIEESELSSKS